MANENDCYNTFENTPQFSITKSEHLRILLLNATLIKGTFLLNVLFFFFHMHKRPYSNEGEDLSHTWGYNRELSITST